ncbi:MAG: hypothetical protein EOP83_31460 [Verrucomicrobiaceae bacterium]|nr:MAG: hypothetical protein EOP83_31460 [Verrucomicrobiaceae bacterium]
MLHARTMTGMMSPADTSGARLWLGHRWYWLCQALGWGSGLLMGVWGNWVRYGDIGEALVRLGNGVMNTILAVALTHVFRAFMLTKGWKEKDLSALAPRVIAVSLISGFALTWFSQRTDPQGWEEAPIKSFALTGVWMSTIFFGWFVFYFAFHYYHQFRDAKLRALKLELSMTEAALVNLRAQMNPHFLFNGLNALRDLIEHDPQGARTMVSRLARLFRASLSTEGRRTIPLEEELEAVEAYLHVEKVRFEDRLEIRRAIPADTLDLRLPPFLLQTLVENAVKYGVATRSTGGYVSYDAFKCDDILAVTVRNPGVLGSPSESTGMGLKMTRERLALLYGDRADLDISCTNGVVVVQVMIPQTPFPG